MQDHYVAKDSDDLHIQSDMGMMIRITAVFTTDAGANNFMIQDERQAVLKTFGPFIFMADKNDRGTST